jgi:glycosylphosphatidylinositol deacylase
MRSVVHTDRQLKELHGRPVVFIPGNGGSFRQVRSLASATAHLQAGRARQLDWFALDLNGELSALDATLLTAQTDFAVRAVRRVLQLYDAPTLDEHQPPPPRVSALSTLAFPCRGGGRVFLRL